MELFCHDDENLLRCIREIRIAYACPRQHAPNEIGMLIEDLADIDRGFRVRAQAGMPRQT
jgi:hypothetical protein